VLKDSLLMQVDNASLVIHHVITAMMGVQAHAQNAELKVTDRCCFCTRVSARLLVPVASLEKTAVKNANLVMQLAAVVLVLHHLSASLVVRGFFCWVPQLVYACQLVLKASILNHLTEHVHLVGPCVNSAALWTLINAPAVLQANSFMNINAFQLNNAQWGRMQTLQLRHVKVAQLDVLRVASCLT